MSRYNPHFANAPAVFDAAARFKDRCLLNQQSLLLDNQPLWVPEHFDVLTQRYVKRPDAGGGGFYDKLAGQLADCTPLDVAQMAELFWLVQLPPINMAAPYKRQRVKFIWDLNPPAPFPEDSPFLTKDVLSGLGSAGTGYNLYLWMEVAFAINAFSDLSRRRKNERADILAEPFAFADWLESIPSGKGRQLYHTLCHVFFPDTFERIFSESQKNKVARAFDIWTPEYRSSRPAKDRGLLEIRHRLERQHPEGVDHYLEPVGTLIAEPTPEKSAVLPEARDVAQLTGVASDGETPAEGTAVLRLAENLILYGPPGTGKTFELERRRKRVFEEGGESTFVTFHPSYAYEDFLGGLRPVASDDGKGIVVRFLKGPFLELCEKAHQNPTLQYVLFIDEINRANVAKVFGELITLIEPAKRVIAGSQPSDTGSWLTVPGLDRPLGVPDNLSIVASMNTADRSIATMDIAMRRRFQWQEYVPESARIEPATVGAIDLAVLLDRINDRLEYLLDRDHRIGHALFIGLDSLPDVVRVLSQQVIPLLQEYFFDDLERVRLALTGGLKKSPFFRSRTLAPAGLFPGSGSAVGSEPRQTFSVTDPSTWTEEHVVALYASNIAEPA